MKHFSQITSNKKFLQQGNIDYKNKIDKERINNNITRLIGYSIEEENDSALITKGIQDMKKECREMIMELKPKMYNQYLLYRGKLGDIEDDKDDYFGQIGTISEVFNEGTRDDIEKYFSDLDFSGTNDIYKDLLESFHTMNFDDWRKYLRKYSCMDTDELMEKLEVDVSESGYNAFQYIHSIFLQDNLFTLLDDKTWKYSYEPHSREDIAGIQNPISRLYVLALLYYREQVVKLYHDVFDKII